VGDTAIVRQRIWSRLHAVALPDSRLHLNFAEVIPDFVGSARATDRVTALPCYAAGDYAFITPDKAIVRIPAYRAVDAVEHLPRVEIVDRALAVDDEALVADPDVDVAPPDIGR
jgi:hypothetical protein